MTEQAPEYSTSNSMDIQAFASLPCAQAKDSPEYQAPTPQEVKAIRNYLGLSQSACARFTGVPFNPEKGSPTVRKWEASVDNRNHKPIPYAAWRLLLAAAKVIDIEDELEKSKQII
ncbi:MAG: hypothetical protein K6L74_17085 [Neptuniibacter sp.]